MDRLEELLYKLLTIKNTFVKIKFTQGFEVLFNTSNLTETNHKFCIHEYWFHNEFINLRNEIGIPLYFSPFDIEKVNFIFEDDTI